MKNITEVKSIRLEKLSIGEYAQFLEGVINLVNKATIEKIGVTPELFAEVQKHSELLTEIIGQSYISQETKALAKIDKERSKMAAFLISSFRLERKNIDENRKESAVILYDLVINYIGVQSFPVREKTQYISGMLNDLNKPAYKAHIKTLGLSKTVASLEEKNKEYQSLSEGRAKNQLENSFVSFKNAKKEINNSYRAITKYAFATNLITPTEESKNFISLLNKLIEDTNNANKQRLAMALTNKRSAKASSVKSISE